MTKLKGESWICDIQRSIEAKGGGKGGDGGAGEARAREEARQAQIRDGMKRIDTTFAQFDDGFFNSREQAYKDYAMPQLEDQWGKTNKQLTYALSRTGNLNSGVAGEQLGDATREYERQKQALTDKARAYSNEARGDVERNRSDLVSQLNAIADPEAAATGAVARAKLLNAVPAFQPVGDLFTKLTDGLATYRNFSDANVNNRGVGLFSSGGGSSSGRNVGGS